MLDVHPPHHPTHTWRDFFLHIATIVVGLLIAIGLEQTVEFFHHRHQVAETRAALRTEREQNRLRLAQATIEFRRVDALLQHNLAVFTSLQHPVSSSAAGPTPLLGWSSTITGFTSAAWQAALHGGGSEFMPQEEVRSYSRLYVYGEEVTQASNEFSHALMDARQFGFRDPNPTHLTPAQLAQQIDLVTAAITKNYRVGVALRNLAFREPDFAPAPTTQELLRISHEPDPNLAKKFSDSRMAETKAAEEAAP